MLSRNSAYIYLLISALIWGAAMPIIHYTTQRIPPLTFLMLRFWISLIFCLPALAFISREVKIEWKKIILILKASTIGHVLSLTFIFLGLTYIQSIEGSLITVFSPIVVTVLGFLYLKEHITKREIEGMLLAFLGAALLIFEPFILGNSTIGGQRLSFFGSLLFILGIFFDAFYTIYVKKNLSEDRIITPTIQIVISFIFASVVFTFLGIGEQFYLFKRLPINQIENCTLAQIDKYNYSKGTICDEKGCFYNNDPSKYFCVKSTQKTNFITYFSNELGQYVQGSGIWGVIYMAVFSGLIAYILYNKGLNQIEAGEASVFYYLQPLFGIPLGVFLLKESISPVFLISAVLIGLGVFWVEKRS